MSGSDFSAIIEREDDWYIASCPQVQGANGQGKTIEECRENLWQAIALILEDRRENTRRRNPSRSRSRQNRKQEA